MYRLTFHQTLLRYSDREIEFSVLYSYFSKTTKFVVLEKFICVYTHQSAREIMLGLLLIYMRES